MLAPREGQEGGELMGFLDKAKTAADQMATRAKEGVDEVQAKRNLQRAYEDLGRTAFHLIEENEISHPRLSAFAWRSSFTSEPGRCCWRWRYSMARSGITRC